MISNQCDFSIITEMLNEKNEIPNLKKVAATVIKKTMDESDHIGTALIITIRIMGINVNTCLGNHL